VVFAKPLIFGEGEDDERKIFMHRVFVVLNVAQIDGPPEHKLSPELVDKSEGNVNQFIEATGADIRIGGDVAAFIPSRDFIKMPPASAFNSMESYYATTFHELGHWSGAEKRLDRNLTTRFGTEAYAAEELVAELTSAFLCAELGIQGELGHAGYLANWLTLLRSDAKAIFTASFKASQGAHYLRSFSQVADIGADQWDTSKSTARDTSGATYSNCDESRERRQDRHNQLFVNSKTTMRPTSQRTASSRFEAPTLLSESHYGGTFLSTP
jgi:antirestriction protein ArdC